MIRAYKKFRDQSHQDRLKSKNKEHHANLKEGGAQNRNKEEDATHKQISQQDRTACDQQHAGSAKNIDWLGAVTDQKLHGKQIKHHLHRAFQAIGGLPKFAWMMMNGNFGNTCTHGTCIDR